MTRKPRTTCQHTWLLDQKIVAEDGVISETWLSFRLGRLACLSSTHQPDIIIRPLICLFIRPPSLYPSMRPIALMCLHMTTMLLCRHTASINMCVHLCMHRLPSDGLSYCRSASRVIYHLSTFVLICLSIDRSTWEVCHLRTCLNSHI